MSDKQPFTEQFDCPRAKGPVQIRGVEVTLRGAGGMPIDAARRYSDCSGSPADQHTASGRTASNIRRHVIEQYFVGTGRIDGPDTCLRQNILPPGSHPQLNGLGRGVAVDTADDLLDLHEMKCCLGPVNETKGIH
jgi:hypothetical protein